jgi:hypothetical protein
VRKREREREEKNNNKTLMNKGWKIVETFEHEE